jgi:hypothetical protein
MMGPQIDWWWYQRHPPDLPLPLRQMLNNRVAFYQNLTAAEKQKFRHRAALYMEANEFIPKSMEGVPPDVKGAVACSVAQLTLGLNDFLLNKFEHIVIYGHPFPSPQFPHHWHTCEHQTEDGVVLFSAEQLMPAFLEPTRYFHIGIYEFARVFRYSYPGIKFPESYENFWEQTAMISGFTRRMIESYIGLPDIDETAVMVGLFFTFPKRMQKVTPYVYESLAAIFNQRP